MKNLILYYTHLNLVNFKNYSAQKVKFSSGFNCFIGQNGMGKTNVLDALYYISIGKSNFGMSDRQLVKHGEIFFRLESSIKGKDEIRVIAKVKPGELKEMSCNDYVYERISEHVGKIPIIMIIPDDTRIASDYSDGRRKLLDTAISQLDKNYLNVLISYNKELKQYNNFLKLSAKNRRWDDDLAHIYHKKLMEFGNIIYNKRKSFIQEFIPVFQKYNLLISKKFETVSCSYKSQLNEDSFDNQIEEAYSKDKILLRSTLGIHKDDLLFEINGRALKKFGSQGQLKTYIITIKLALLQLIKDISGKTPVLMLDDIFDKLDSKRVKRLIDLIDEKFDGQVFITDTHPTRLKELLKNVKKEIKLFIVSSGTMRQIT